MKYAKRMETVRGSEIRDVAKKIADHSRENIIKLSGGIPEGRLFPIEELWKVTEDIFKGDAISALQYGFTKGNPELLSLLKERMQKREGLCITEDHILITTGCQQGIALASMAFLDKGDTVIIEKPSYLDGLNACIPFEVNMEGVETDEDGIMLEQLEKTLLAEPRVKMIYVIPNFQNPTGRAWSLERRNGFMSLMARPEFRDIVILEDNPYGEIRFEGEFCPSLKSMDDRDQVVYLSSFSKVLCPGLRVAWAVGEPDLMEHLEILKEGMDLQSNEFAQAQVVEYLKRYDLDAHIEKLKKSYRIKRDIMLEAIKSEFPKEVRYTVPEGGMFLWIELPGEIDTGDLLSQALDAGVAYIPGASFFAGGTGRNTARLNFTAVEPDEIAEGIRRLGEVLRTMIE